MVNEIKNFALIGVGGFIAPRHLKAIKETGNVLEVSLDKNDSVGIIDSYFPSASFFTEFERFDRHLEKLRQEENKKIDYVSICSPSYLHDAHVRFALRIGADVICEKPLVIRPWNIDALERIEKNTGRRINTILQLRLHPTIIGLKNQIRKENNKIFDVDFTYITYRGKWYFTSWKGDIDKSGGIVTNIGIHFFDILYYIFGKVRKNTVHMMEKDKASGYLELEKANIRWFLSLDYNDLPENSKISAYRSIRINGKEIPFFNMCESLHLRSYEEILGGKGWGIKDARPSIEIVSEIRDKDPIGLKGEYHPFCIKRNKI